MELLEDGPCSPLGEVGGQEDVKLPQPPPVVGQVLEQTHLTPLGRFSLDTTAHVLERLVRRGTQEAVHTVHIPTYVQTHLLQSHTTMYICTYICTESYTLHMYTCTYVRIHAHTSSLVCTYVCTHTATPPTPPTLTHSSPALRKCTSSPLPMHPDT